MHEDSFVMKLRNDGGAETELMARLFSTSLVTLLPAVSYSLKVSLVLAFHLVDELCLKSG